MKITSLGGPPQDENGVLEQYRNDWHFYTIAVQFAIVDEPCYPEWVDDKFYLIPSRLLKGTPRSGAERCVHAAAASEVDRRYEWFGDADSPILALARAWAKERKAHEETVMKVKEAIQPLLR